MAGSELRPDACGVCDGDGTSCVCWSLAPDFEWDDLSNTTNFPDRLRHPLGDDEWVLVTLPFDFQFFGEVYPANSVVSIFSNGFLTFGTLGLGSATATAAQANAAMLSLNYVLFGHTAPIPSLGLPGPMLAVYWADLNPAAGGSVYSWADNTTLIVEWAEVPFWNTDIEVHFEVRQDSHLPQLSPLP